MLSDKHKGHLLMIFAVVLILMLFGLTGCAEQPQAECTQEQVIAHNLLKAYYMSQGVASYGGC